MKQPKFIIFNDAHLKKENEEAVLLSVRHMVSYAVEHGIKSIVFAGDLFHFRKAQEESLFQTCNSIFDEISKAGIHLYFFAGNHDRTSYTSFNSFLDIYRFHPNTTFAREITKLEIEGISVTLLPFFDDSMLVPMLEEAEGTDLLISHFELKGSNHLGHISEKETITPKMLRKWTKTYLGHYHNTQEVTPNIIHLPSLRQNDHGENNLKGFSVIFDDLSYEIIKGVFKEFVTLKLDIEDLDTEAIKSLIVEHENSPNTVRFEISGSDEKLKALDVRLFDNTGIDLKKKYDKEYDYDDPEEKDAPKVVQQFNKESIEEEFKNFCEKKGYDYDFGKTLLDEFLTKKRIK